MLLVRIMRISWFLIWASMNKMWCMRNYVLRIIKQLNSDWYWGKGPTPTCNNLHIFTFNGLHDYPKWSLRNRYPPKSAINEFSTPKISGTKCAKHKAHFTILGHNDIYVTFNSGGMLKIWKSCTFCPQESRGTLCTSSDCLTVFSRLLNIQATPRRLQGRWQ